MHILSAGTESNNRGHNISVKRFQTLPMYLFDVLLLFKSDLRLRNGSSLHEGIVEEFSLEYKEWINFCLDGFDGHEARVVCRNLGFPDAAFALNTDSVFGSDTRSYYAVSLDCEGSKCFDSV